MPVTFFCNPTTHVVVAVAQGGLEAVQALNEEKAALVYDAIAGSSGFYASPVDAAARSVMNIPFTIPAHPELEKDFVAEAAKRGMVWPSCQGADPVMCCCLRLVCLRLSAIRACEAPLASIRPKRCRVWVYMRQLACADTCFARRIFG